MFTGNCEPRNCEAVCPERAAINKQKERGQMKNQLKTLATLALVSALSAGLAQTTAAGTTSTSSTHKKPVTRKAVPKKPSVESQIQSLREDMQTQIQQLKQQLSDRDQQLQQAQQSAAAAQAAAAQAQQQAAQQAATTTENTQAVTSLQGAVSDLKTNSTSMASTIQDEQTQVHKAMLNPDSLHYKGITITPGGFLAAETVYRSAATGGGLNTPMTGIPLQNSAQGQYSEFYGSGRQSRVSMLAEGKIPSMTMRGYVEADFLSAGVTSNNNESNSYTMRQRQAWAQAELQNGWTFTGGQMWSLTTETTKGLQNRSEILPSSIDPQYEAGFVWERQYGFRVTKNMGSKLFFGMSAENAQIPSVVGHGTPFNFIVGQAGTGGGLYNSTANYASNVAPDFVAKVAFEPGWGHYELFGVGRFFRARIYPNAVYTTVAGVTTASGSSAGAYNDATTGGGIGGGFRLPTLNKRLDVGLKGLWGDGIGRYGDAQIGDTTVRPDGQLALLHGFSALSTLEFHATPRLDLYFNYGGDYAGRRYFLTSKGTKSVGYGSYLNVQTGCGTEPVPGSTTAGYTPGSQSNCTADTKDVQEFTAGYWYDFYKGPAGRLRQGIQYSYFQRNIWSGIGPTPEGTDNGLWTSFRYYLP
jgi:hypothetical protein